MCCCEWLWLVISIFFVGVGDLSALFLLISDPGNSLQLFLCKILIFEFGLFSPCSVYTRPYVSFRSITPYVHPLFPECFDLSWFSTFCKVSYKYSPFHPPSFNGSNVAILVAQPSLVAIFCCYQKLFFYSLFSLLYTFRVTAFFFMIVNF